MEWFNTTRANTKQQALDDKTVHDWYRFVLSYPDHLVKELLQRFDVKRTQTVLDPFVGTGTTLVECKRNQIPSMGIDANPVTAFASRIKTEWNLDVVAFEQRSRLLFDLIRDPIRNTGAIYSQQMTFDDLLPMGDVLREGSELRGENETIRSLLPKNWISETPLKKCLIVKEGLDLLPQDSVTEVLRLALMKVFVAASNLGFGPEVYVSKKKTDANVMGLLTDQVRRMQHDLTIVRPLAHVPSKVFHGDARCLAGFVDQSADFVISSPPYPNEKDYSRITRLELLLLEFVQSKAELREMKQQMLRSHTRNIYVKDNDTQFVADIPEITELAAGIEQRRIDLGKTSGFERLYHRVVTEYFGGMYRVLEQLQQVTPKGAKVALVVGDQMSYFRIPIYTARLLSIIARRKLNYTEVETLLFRTRKSTVTKMDVEEHILILERC